MKLHALLVLMEPQTGSLDVDQIAEDIQEKEGVLLVLKRHATVQMEG